jgi:apolipoprotein N-acyltransferase
MPFYEHFSGLWLLIAFVPLLLLEDDLAQRGKRRIFLWAALTFILWNLCTTYWIMYATFGGMVGAVLIASLLEATVFWLFSVVKRRVGRRLGYVAFVVFWLTWEHFFLNSEISWPWLTLGNGFSKDILLIQWYDTTGALGGSLWALVCNVLVVVLLKSKPAAMRRVLVGIALWVLIPLVISLCKFYTYQTPQNKPCRVAVIQPNIDPYYDKFQGMSPTQQLNLMLGQAGSVVDSATHYVIAPETALHTVWENTMHSGTSIVQIRELCKQYPMLRFITGAMSFYEYGSAAEPPTPTAHRHMNSDQWYDSHNSAIQVDTGLNVQICYKSKLVIGVEMLPYPKYMRFLDKWAINLGGTAGGLGTQKERVLLTNPSNGFKAGVIICYESIYGEYCTEYVRKGANVLFIITNDGWWRASQGHKQHFNYARLRAIETRRSIARSANTGVSAIISQRGEILHRTAWWTPDAFASTIYANSVITPYVRWGDYLARLAQLVSLLIILCALIPKRNRK